MNGERRANQTVFHQIEDKSGFEKAAPSLILGGISVTLFCLGFYELSGIGTALSLAVALKEMRSQHRNKTRNNFLR